MIALVPGATAAALDVTGAGERWYRAMQLMPFSPLLSVPSAAVALAAAGTRRPVLALAASALAIWQVGLMRSGPAKAANAGSWAAIAGKGTDVRLASVNLQRNADTAAAMADLVLRHDADVVVAEEFTPGAQPAFAGEDFIARFPHRFEAPEESFFGSAVYSRFPIVEAEDRPMGGRHMVVAALDIDGSHVTLVAVHTQAPIHRRDEEPWRRGYIDLEDVVRSAPGPVVLAGDWNATMGCRPFRRLLRRQHLVDAHLAVGRAWARTWPDDRRFIPPLLLLDHVVVGGGVVIEAVGERRITGSDHRSLFADLVVP